ncbi:MAG: hypothetical protein ACR2KX_05800 [Chitinophagaceae bacterium]
MSTPSQIFHTKKLTRWNSVKWTTRILAMVAVFLLVILTLALFSGSLPSMPNLQSKARDYELQIDPSTPLSIPFGQSKKLKGFKEFLINKERKIQYENLKTFLWATGLKDPIHKNNVCMT